MNEELINQKQLSEKLFKLYMLMNEWVHILQDKKSISQYLIEHNYKKIIIYGFSYVGETLYRELYDSDVSIECIVDQRAEYIYSKTKVQKPTENVPKADLIIVTVMVDGEKIKEKLCMDTLCEVITIEELLMSI